MDPLAGEEERGKGVEAPQEGPGPQGQQVAGLVRLGGRGYQLRSLRRQRNAGWDSERGGWSQTRPRDAGRPGGAEDGGPVPGEPPGDPAEDAETGRDETPWAAWPRARYGAGAGSQDVALTQAAR